MPEDSSAEPRAQITVVMSHDLLEWIRAEASQRELKPSTLIRLWLLERRAEQEREATQ